MSVRHIDGTPYVRLTDHDGQPRWFGPDWTPRDIDAEIEATVRQVAQMMLLLRSKGIPVVVDLWADAIHESVEAVVA